MSLERLIDGLVSADVSCVVVGMVAGQFYGSRIATYDLDIVYETTDDNVRKLTMYLRSVDAFVKETWPNEGVASEFDETVLRRDGSLTLGTSEGEIDVLDRIDGFADYAAVLAHSTTLPMASGGEARLLTLAGLIAAKRASDREKDRSHLVELEALHELQRRKER